MSPTRPPSHEPTPEAFPGFTPLDANYLYCPNQFFDVVLPHASRGTLRVIAFLLRKTLGWLDEHGQPVEQRITVSYKELIDKAGVSRGALRQALDDALKLKAIRCVQKGKPNEKGKAGRAASYELRWDHPEAPYTRDVADFRGFFAGEGHRSPIPNGFFDVVIPGETLATVQTVGAILRHTVGYQNQFGGRRQHAALSYDYLQRYTRIASRRHLAAAIRRGLEGGYIRRVSEGTFHPDAARRQSAQYGVRWLGQPPEASDAPAHPATDPGANSRQRSKKTPARSSASVQKRNQPIPGNGSKKEPAIPAETRAKKGTSQRSRRTPGKASNKDTDRNNTFKNTPTNNAAAVAVEERNRSTRSAEETTTPEGASVSEPRGGRADRDADAVIAALRAAGLGPRVAGRLVADFGPGACADQLDWLAARNPTTNPAGMLRRAIEQGWEAPGRVPASGSGVGSGPEAEAFAAHAYAAMNGHAGEPIAEPTAGDCEYAARVLAKLRAGGAGLRDTDKTESVRDWGRSFGRFVRNRRAGTVAKFGTVAAALRMHGDAWVADRMRSASRPKRDFQSEAHNGGALRANPNPDVGPDRAAAAVSALIAGAGHDPAAASALSSLKAAALRDCPGFLARKLAEADPAESRNLRRLIEAAWEASQAKEAGPA